MDMHGYRFPAPRRTGWRRGSLLVVVLVLAACAAPRATRAPASLRIVCPVDANPVECFAPASARCGPDGYDLVDARGRPATLADARYGPVEARCRR